MELDFGAIAPYVPEILAAIRITLVIAAMAFTMGAVLGLFIALGRLSRRRWIRLPATVFVDVFLATPVLVQLLWIYYALPILTGILIPPIPALALTLGLNATAVMGENYRAGIQAIDRGQWDAAQVLGLSNAQAFRLVVFPQATKIILPPLASTSIVLVKDSSIATFIGVGDLLNVGRGVAIQLFRPIEVFTFVAFVYFLLTYPISIGATMLERRLRVKQ